MKEFFKSKIAHIKDVEKRNTKFNGLSKPQKRREVAWDALTLIIGKLLKGAKGTYWNGSLAVAAGVNGFYGSPAIKAKTSKQLQENVLNIKKTDECKVCARGAVMLSTIRLGNCLSPKNDSIKDGSNGEFERGGFEEDNFMNMESEYESNDFKHPYYRRSTKKLANMLCNVIVNGKFNTADKTDYLTQFEIEL